MILWLIAIMTILGLSRSEDGIPKPPIIDVNPKSHIYNKSKVSIQLDCQASGTPNPTITWRVSDNAGGPWKELENDRFTHDLSTGTLKSSKALAEDEGYYQCLVSNKWGTTFSDSAQLQYAVLKYENEMNKDTVKDIHVNENDAVTLHCLGMVSLPKIHAYVLWTRTESLTKPHSKVTLNDRIIQTENGSLIFLYVRKEDANSKPIYVCNIKNRQLRDETLAGAAQKLIINSVGTQPTLVPQIVYAPENTLAIRGNDINFECVVRSSPKAEITMTFEERTLPNNVKRSPGKLKISNVNSVNEGSYICVATTNKRNLTLRQSADKRWHLTVESSPYWESEEDKPHNLEVVEGQTAEFVCKPTAVPEANVVWMKNTEVLDPSNHKIKIVGSKLMIMEVCKDCDEPDQAYYQCVSSNKHGSVHGYGYLKVFTKTIMTVKPQDHDLTDMFGQSEITKIELQCDAKGDANHALNFIWYKNTRRLYHQEKPWDINNTTNTLTLLLGGYATEEDMYSTLLGTYKCEATNGVSTAFAEAEITGKRDMTTPPPTTAEPEEPHYFVWTYVIIAVTILVGLLVVSFIAFMVYLYMKHIQNNEEPMGPIGPHRKSSNMSGVSGTRHRRRSSFLGRHISTRRLSNLGLEPRPSSRTSNLRLEPRPSSRTSNLRLEPRPSSRTSNLRLEHRPSSRLSSLEPTGI